MKYLFIIGVLAVAIWRVVKYVLDRTEQGTVIYRVKKNPLFAARYATSLDISYFTLNDCDIKAFHAITAAIEAMPAVLNYKILHTHRMEDNCLLVFTELSFEDVGVNLRGDTTGVKAKAYHNFLIKHDAAKNEMAICSELYVDATSKFQKTEFYEALLKTVVTPA